ncbi:AfsA-related hotdog domain-containing protein [Streptomyces sp. NPDC052101]|uniref:AfsA-related hotdog domain-containing protein n=1 Tax=Streptomyces sp. NPDC052101 TaxID=3155763 RepID=UPI00343411B6
MRTDPVIARETSARETSARETSARETSARETVAREVIAREPEPLHHLVHRPGPALGAPATAGPVRQEFGLATVLPLPSPPFAEGTGPCHDPCVPVEILRKMALFVAHQHFDVPARRETAFAEATLALDPADAWRRGALPAQLDLDLSVDPVDVVGGVPRGLVCRAGLRVADVPCGTASARLVFLTPGVYRLRRAQGRSRALGGPDELDELDGLDRLEGLEGAGSPVGPGDVARTDPRDVLLTGARHTTDTLVAYVRPHPGLLLGHIHGVGDHLPSLVLMEATRQAAVLFAQRERAVPAGSCVLTEWQARFHGFAEPDLPLRLDLRARPRAPHRAPDGHPALLVDVQLTQRTHQVGHIRMTVVRDG